MTDLPPIDEAKLTAAQERIRDADKRFRALGRPSNSSCACKAWPCDCSCHRPPRVQPKVSS